MKDLSDYVVFQNEMYWIDSDGGFLDGEATPFEVGVPFEFTYDSVTRIGIVECDDGVDKFSMIPFTVA